MPAQRDTGTQNRPPVPGVPPCSPQWNEKAFYLVTSTPTLGSSSPEHLYKLRRGRRGPGWVWCRATGPSPPGVPERRGRRHEGGPVRRAPLLLFAAGRRQKENAVRQGRAAHFSGDRVAPCR